MLNDRTRFCTHNQFSAYLAPMLFPFTQNSAFSTQHYLSSQLSHPQTAAQETLPWAYSMAFFSEQQQRIRSRGDRLVPMGRLRQ